MHLNHSIGTHPEIKTTFCHHEQALAMAAEAYARLTQRMALVNVTSGPGGTNAITGVYGAFVEFDPDAGHLRPGEESRRRSARPGCRCASSATRNSTSSRSSGRSPNMSRWSPTPRRSATISKRLSTSRPAGGRGPSGSTSRSTFRRAKIDPDELDPGFDPAELDEPWKKTDVRGGGGRNHRAAARRPSGRWCSPAGACASAARTSSFLEPGRKARAYRWSPAGTRMT